MKLVLGDTFRKCSLAYPHDSLQTYETALLSTLCRGSKYERERCSNGEGIPFDKHLHTNELSSGARTSAALASIYYGTRALEAQIPAMASFGHFR